MTKKKKYIVFIFGILFLSFLVIGGTFAYLMLSVDVTNGRYAGITDCMIIDYDITNDDGTLPISGTLFQSSTPKGGLSGKVTMNINSACTFSRAPATIHLNIDSSTSSLLLSEGALKYAVYENVNSEPVSTGVITTTGNITIYQGFNVTQTLTSYYIYVWLDGNIADNDYVNLSFSGAISASVVQNEGAGSSSGGGSNPDEGFYTISYSANGGIDSPVEQVKVYGETIALADVVPTRTGYEFLGWSTSPTATTAVYQPGESYSLNASVTLYAVWEIETYTISYNANGGSGAPSEQTKTHDETLILSNTIPTKNGYEFLGWSTSSIATIPSYLAGDNYTSNSSVTLYAVWKSVSASTWTVNYDVNGGTSGPSSQIKERDKTLTLSTVIPTKIGYDFIGWGTTPGSVSSTYQPGDNYTLNEDLTLYAIWKIKTYTITYNTNGGTGDLEEQIKTYDQPLTLSTVVPTKTGYDFVGWGVDSNVDYVSYQPGEDYVEEESIILYAIWEIKTYTIGYNTNGGSGNLEEQIKLYGEPLELSEVVPTKDGYDFLGWSTSSSATGATYQPGGTYSTNESVTLYAVWKIKTYTIAYNANGGDNAPASQVKIYNESLVLSDVIPLRDGYDFLGWGTSSSSTIVTYLPEDEYITNSSVTLYALWKIKTYTISFDANGGSGTPSEQIKIHDQTLVLSDIIPTKTGYNFLGWGVSADDLTVEYQPGEIYTANSSVTLYAIWGGLGDGPILDSGMIPVIISNNGTVTTILSTDEAWYDYENKQWANAILVTSASRNSYLNTTGVTVNAADILGYYVWIPRFKYKIWTTSSGSSPQTIDVIIETSSSSKSSGTVVGDYLTHPAFTFGTKELSGFWVGKFETTGTDSTPTVLPNLSSLSSQNLKTQFETSLKFAGGTLNTSTGNVTFSGNNTYGLSSSMDSHMMKNSEWGAVMYLSHSLYGKNAEIRLNNYYNSGTLTGCGGITDSIGQSTSCTLTFGKVNNYAHSTTGNVSGIFDMSGGLYEHLMGNYNNSVGSSGFTIFPATKYYDKYTSTDTLKACNGGLCFGHALFETAGWYSDRVSGINNNYPFISRGESYSGGASAGAFAYAGFNGSENINISWRSVLASELSISSSGGSGGGTVEPESYTITYNANGGSGAPLSQTKLDGVPLTLSSTIPTRTGYDFLGWSTSSTANVASYSAGDTYTMNASMALYAVWKIRTYTISYNANGGSGAPDAQTKTYGVSLTLSDTIPVRDGYTFKGWGTSSTSISPSYQAGSSYTSNVSLVLYAVWEVASATTYTITYNANGGNNPPVSQTKNHGVALVLSGTIPKRTGYDFLGWATSSSATTASYQPGDSYTSNSSVTLYAVWKIRTYTITYNANGGSGAPDAQTKTYGVALTLRNNIPTRTGYEFLGWSTSLTATTASYQPGGSYTSNTSVTLYAVWKNKTATTYTITYNANGGSGAPSSQTQTYGVALTLSNTVPIRTGYKFVGWSVSSTAYTASYQAGDSYTSNASVTLYAVWRNTFVGDPVLDTGMIPITISNNGTVTTVSPADSSWYDYDNKQWANAILVTSSSRNSYLNTVGKTVNQADILAYFVWIPRYKYKIWTINASSTTSPQTIDIVFESSTTSKSNGTAVGQYLTHPAFTFGTKELSGFWVGKFETSGSSSLPMVLPNEDSLTEAAGYAIKSQFDILLKFAGGTFNSSTGTVTFAGNNTYGLTSFVDSHMMKNSEWGAVMYLSHSNYGINTEIRLNNYYNLGTLTGCGASSANASQSSTCAIRYGAATSYPQSTTGNISGVFDMSGGVPDDVMGIYNNVINLGGFSKLPPTKYYDLYTFTNISSCTLATCGGHALYETTNWYSDLNIFIDSTWSWIFRGGGYDDDMGDTGGFAFRASNGGGFVGRPVLVS